MWCTTCGSYARSVARGLAKSCPGRFLGVGYAGGLPRQLKVLQSGRHPVTLRRIAQPSRLAAATCSTAAAASCISLGCRPPVALQSSAERFEALRQRVRAKEAASAAAKVTAELTSAETTRGVAGAPAILRRITGKRPPGRQRIADACAQMPPGKRPWLHG